MAVDLTDKVWILLSSLLQLEAMSLSQYLFLIFIVSPKNIMRLLDDLEERIFLTE